MLTEGRVKYLGPVIDGFVHHRWLNETELLGYMSRGWAEYLGRPLKGVVGKVLPYVPARRYMHPFGDEELALSQPNGGADSYEVLRRHLLDSENIERVVLGHDGALRLPVLPNHYLAREVIRAVNDWTLDRWLSSSGNERIYALILVPNQLPDAAVAEIRRVGKNARMVGIVMAATGLSKPFGHPVYHPIYKAASDLGLPVVIRSGGDATPDSLVEATAGGRPLTYAESRILEAHPLMTHVVSLIGQGVFEKYPDLRVLVVGAGVAWLPALMWKFDTNFLALRSEAPWMRQSPTKYLREHIRISTFPLDRPHEPERLVRLLEAYGEPQRILCFASGYPSRHADDVADIAARLPDQWLPQVMRENAMELFRWPDSQPRTRRASNVEVGEMIS